MLREHALDLLSAEIEKRRRMSGEKNWRRVNMAADLANLITHGFIFSAGVLLKDCIREDLFPDVTAAIADWIYFELGLAHQASKDLMKAFEYQVPSPEIDVKEHIN